MIFPGGAGRLKFIYRRDAFGAGTRNAEGKSLQNNCRPWLPQTHARRCGCAKYILGLIGYALGGLPG